MVPKNTEPTNTLPWIIFELQQQLYAISTERVTGITQMPSLTVVPNAPPEFMGVTNLRGNVTPVLNLKKLLCITDNREETARAAKLLEKKLEASTEYVKEITRCLKTKDEFCVSDTDVFFGDKFDKNFVSDRSEVSEQIVQIQALETELLKKVNEAKNSPEKLREAENCGKKLIRTIKSAHEKIVDESYKMLIFLSEVPGSVEADLCFVVDKVRAVDGLEMIERKNGNRCLYMSGYVSGVAHNEKIKGEILVTDDNEIVKMASVYNESVEKNSADDNTI